MLNKDKEDQTILKFRIGLLYIPEGSLLIPRGLLLIHGGLLFIPWGC